MSDRIGPFKILGVLGEGGFGVVYEAEQTEPVRRRVALKVIKPGMDSKAVVARFEAERQALAVMDHPCIAKVFDGGMTEAAQGARPYFVMELVKGVPITDFCDRERLTIDERCALFTRVCDAVQHAHTKGVIHRDLKPSNVLVAYDGEGKASPRVIDFGVAKALNQRLTEATIFTERGQLIGTPEYMSPEQAEMSGLDIDTRSDVYSLGVLLYELLTGVLPFDRATLRAAGFAEIQRIIREQAPPKPSTRLSTAAGGDAESVKKIAAARRSEVRSITGELRRDLDWVLLKCLEKERMRRYETAAAVGDELGRFLRNEPIQAGPPTIGYVARKFVARNAIGFSVALMVVSSLVISVLVSSFYAIEAGRARRASDERLQELREVLSQWDVDVYGVLESGLEQEIPMRWAEAVRASFGPKDLQRAVIQISLVSLTFDGAALTSEHWWAGGDREVKFREGVFESAGVALVDASRTLLALDSGASKESRALMQLYERWLLHSGIDPITDSLWNEMTLAGFRSEAESADEGEIIDSAMDS